jgi:hypothetical protein
MKLDPKAWVGVDFDGTLATYTSKQHPSIGDPVPAMVARNKRWHAAGMEVRIVTARAQDRDLTAVRNWLLHHLGFMPPITDRKDYDMEVLYDDRAVRVEKNTGRLVGVEEDQYGQDTDAF